MTRYFLLHLLLVSTLYSLGVAGKSLPTEEIGQADWRTQDSSQGWRNSVAAKPKYYEGRDQFGKQNGFDEDKSGTWRGNEYDTERTTTFSPPKGGYYQDKFTPTTRKPWYTRFKNWSKDKYKQVKQQLG